MKEVIINQRQGWLGFCGDLHYLSHKVFKIDQHLYSRAVKEVLICLNELSTRDTVIIKGCGENFQTRSSLEELPRPSISV